MITLRFGFIKIIVNNALYFTNCNLRQYFTGFVLLVLIAATGTINAGVGSSCMAGAEEFATPNRHEADSPEEQLSQEVRIAKLKSLTTTTDTLKDVTVKVITESMDIRTISIVDVVHPETKRALGTLVSGSEEISFFKQHPSRKNDETSIV